MGISCPLVDINNEKQSLFGGGMEFRLTYEGPVNPASSRNGIPDNKHQIRKVFHRQLKRLWAVSPSLKAYSGPQFLTVTTHAAPATSQEALAEKFERNGYKFVPLVTEELSLKCDVKILFLRPDPPGQIYKSGDIDNRLKTIFDALRMPTNRSEFGKVFEPPSEEETPFYCLLEDDFLITSVSVETDMLLQPVSKTYEASDACLIISVNIQPLRLTYDNMHLG
ncbi:MAG: hypothetical protein ACYCZB_11800 [Acidiphilium sp.]